MNRRATWILVGVAALLAAYVWYSGQARNTAANEATATPAASRGTVFDITADQISGLRIVDRVNNREVALSKDASGQWQITAPGAGPADPAVAPNVAAQFTNLFTSATLTTTTDLAPFGVLSPTYTLELDLVDGRKLKAAVGDKTPTGTGYYVLREGETDVLVVSTSGLDNLFTYAATPPYMPTATPTPSPTPEATLPATEAAATAPPGAATAADPYEIATELPDPSATP
jgi:hypothetical protein